MTQLHSNTRQKMSRYILPYLGLNKDGPISRRLCQHVLYAHIRIFRSSRFSSLTNRTIIIILQFQMPVISTPI